MSENQEIIHPFTELFKQYSDRFIAFAVTYVGDRDVASDIAMDSFMYYWEKKDSLANNSNPPAYILATIKHKCLNHLRSQAIDARARRGLVSQQSEVLKVRISTLEALDSQEIFSEAVQGAVRRAVDSLPEKTREIFILSRVDEKTYKQIAEQLSLTVKSVEFEISKATRILRALLKDSSLYLSVLFVIEFGLFLS